MNTKPWEIDWKIVRANEEDVCYDSKIKLGDELGRFAQSIGPLRINHNHWGGWHIDASRKEVEMTARCEQMFELLKGCCNNIMGFSDMKFLEEASKIIQEIEQHDLPTT